MAAAAGNGSAGRRCGRAASFVVALIFGLFALAQLSVADATTKRDWPTPVGLPAWLPGVNLSVGEFGSGQRLWFDYGYPNTAEIDYYAAKGFKVFRIPFRANRLFDKSASGSLSFRSDRAALEKLIDHAASKHTFVILDMHDYGMSISGKLIGRDPGAAAEFARCWGRIGAWLKRKPNVIFALMNEPNKQSATEWLRGANAAIRAIREAGAGQTILVPGSYWDGAHSWVKTDNDTVMLGVRDPINNYAYEAHQYLDTYSTGDPSMPAVRGMGAVAAKPFTDWLRANGKRGFIGEFGFTAASQSVTEGNALAKHLWQNRDVYLGFSYWAGGPWWGDYAFAVEPKNIGTANVTDRPQMGVLRRYLRQ